MADKISNWLQGREAVTGTINYIGCIGSGRLVGSEQIATVTMGSIMSTSDALPRHIEFASCPVCGLRVRIKEGRTVQH